MKNILGLDLGTNSIGWAVVSKSDDGKYTQDIKLGSRIIPMSQDVLGKFDSGVTESQTAVRTSYRGMRRLRERCLLRRERLHRVLHVMNFLPEHYDNALGWNKNQNSTYGKFLNHGEPKLAWRKDETGKMQFLFMDSFNEMLADFAKHQPGLLAGDKKIPLDWTLYYLRKKALTQPISKQELAWIILNFNQKRGYYQLRGEEEEQEKKNKLEEYYKLKVVKVEATDEQRGDSRWYNIHLENGWIYRRASKMFLDEWVGKEREFIVTTDIDENGNPKLDKEGNVKRSFRAPGADDWALQKKRTENSIESSHVTVGEYIYDNLLKNPSEKVRGKLVRTVERKFYKEELKRIISKQTEFIPELRDKALLEDCIRELYARNIPHQDSLKKKDFVYLIVDDLLFYQRPLKSKKSLISDCPYESYPYVDKSTGEIKTQHIKVVAKSNPYFQEFRLWQFIQNLRLLDRESLNEDDVTAKYLQTPEDYTKLYQFLDDRKAITQEQLLKDFFGLKKPKGKDTKYPLRWNYVEDKEYPCNETRYLILSALKKAEIEPSFLTREMEQRLWHLLYSVEDNNELIHALEKLQKELELPNSFVEELKKIPSFKKEYGAYSEKAVKKLLSVMRMGTCWSEDGIPASVKERITTIIKGEAQDVALEKAVKQHISLAELKDFQGLPVWLACYVVYGRHSESSEITRWETPEDLMTYIRNFKQYSMRNPIVEQCVLESLRTVHDIWVKYGHIDEIHLELGRNMKSTAEERARISERNLANENTNQRIKYLLMELKNDGNISDVRPYSPMQQEILRIYEEGALTELSREDPDFAEISRISKLAQPTSSELTKYKLWLEQRYRSPYTGKPIPLSRLFTPAYQIEHVIPQSRFFNDSLVNKVICEAEVNGLKSNMLGLEFIKAHGGEVVHCPTLGNVTVFTEEQYTKFVKDHYSANRAKLKNLMMEDIPEEFIQRQMNDSRYISRVVKQLLSNVVREENEAEATSKNLIPCTGGITDRLKQDWGLNDIWNKIVSPRFQRMNDLTQSDAFGHWEDKDGKKVFQTTMPLELQRGFSKKRIDHRHHAMDALVIALASRNIVNYLNNESANDEKLRHDLKRLLCGKGGVIIKPWETFTQDAYKALQDIVVSFKHYIRVINKASNYYEHYDENGKKVNVAQKGESMWAIRKPLHKETVFAHVNLRRVKAIPFNKALENPSTIVNKDLKHLIKTLMDDGMDKKKVLNFFKKEDGLKFHGQDISKVEVYYFTDDVEKMVAVRKPLDDSFDAKKIQSITDTGIQKILLNYLATKYNDPKVAFSPEGIMEMNEHIEEFNGGKPHQPILKVRVSETLGEKYPVGYGSNKDKKFVEAQSGTNLYFAIYENEAGNRNYQTIPLFMAAERMKQNLPPVPEANAKGDKLKFYLSPNDLVYVPEESEQNVDINELKKNRIYKFVSCTSTSGYFVPSNVATVLMNKVEYQSLNKVEKSIDDKVIKAVCWKLEVDRLGNIVKIIK